MSILYVWLPGRRWSFRESPFHMFSTLILIVLLKKACYLQAEAQIALIAK